ncbi:hypothetical protein F3X54_09400 [Salmonella enterica subsp. enterica]|nr:hypothetical protein [Salmonella enterica subsp. enterica serovar Lagos]
MFNSENIGFIRLIRKILLCDACRIFSSHCFTHCGACHCNDKTDIHMNNVCLMSVRQETMQRGEGKWLRSLILVQVRRCYRRKYLNWRNRNCVTGTVLVRR